MNTGLAVETTQLVKVFGDDHAVDGVDPAVPAGTSTGSSDPAAPGRAGAVSVR